MKIVLIFIFIYSYLYSDARYDEAEIKEDVSSAWNWVNESFEKVKGSIEEFRTDKDGELLDNKKLIEKFEAKAEDGNALAQYYLGLTYLYAKDAYHDRDKALMWLKKSMKNGCESAGDFLNENDMLED